MNSKDNGHPWPETLRSHRQNCYGNGWPEAYEFIGKMHSHRPKPYLFKGNTTDIHDPKPYEFIVEVDKLVTHGAKLYLTSWIFWKIVGLLCLAWRSFFCSECTGRLSYGCHRCCSCLSLRHRRGRPECDQKSNIFQMPKNSSIRV